MALYCQVLYFAVQKDRIMYKLTTKEEEIMERIWQLGACTPKDVQALYRYIKTV